ncbi:histidine phosphatase family protein [Arthrobacter gandavensis]|uniref:histidine phosphatase family protein n=1 Tax=Arthrobacter gandavensis TaxID=169960 RepID=UPI0018907989|nr:histidine phosphatase family protein [Arthrobacter gandavensis]MBF4994563.1 histidine phosphatase family protein [Arthrobacter gandavensis]
MSAPNLGPAVPDLTPAGTPLPILWLVRHGETEWSRQGNYTGLTDIPLTPEGEAQAAAARGKIGDFEFDRVFSSPLVRARRTAELLGYPSPEVLPHAHEWDYGQNEGRRNTDVRAENPGYIIWNDGVPGGETLAQVAGRADRIISTVQAGCGTPMDQEPDSAPLERALLVAHGHFLRILAARWLGLAPDAGRHLVLGTAAVCVLGWDKHTPAILKWNM